MAFFLAMVMHPDVQRRAQAEIDSVVGKDRLPTIEDKEDLPYIRSIVAEIFRWHTPGPLGMFPHSIYNRGVLDSFFKASPVPQQKTMNTTEHSFTRGRRSSSVFGTLSLVQYSIFI